MPKDNSLAIPPIHPFSRSVNSYGGIISFSPVYCRRIELLFSEVCGGLKGACVSKAITMGQATHHEDAALAVVIQIQLAPRVKQSAAGGGCEE